MSLPLFHASRMFAAMTGHSVLRPSVSPVPRPGKSGADSMVSPVPGSALLTWMSHTLGPPDESQSGRNRLGVRLLNRLVAGRWPWQAQDDLRIETNDSLDHHRHIDLSLVAVLLGRTGLQQRDEQRVAVLTAD